MAFYRFINNVKVDESSIIGNMSSKCGSKVVGKEIITIMDTTEINCSERNNRIVDDKGIGYLSDDRTRGFHMHPAYCLDANTFDPQGIAGVRIIERQKSGSLIPKEMRLITERESDKWYTTPKELRDGILKGASHNIFVFDREGDIYEVLCEIKDETTDFVIRGSHDRRIKSDIKGVNTIKDQLESEESKGKISFTKRLNNGKKEKINACVKYTKLRVTKPSKSKKYIANLQPELELNVVEVKQIGASSTGEKVRWFLLTSMGVDKWEDALRVIKIYQSRWKIEELFRVMKKEGFDLESSELENGQSIRKLSLFIMEAALKIEQLKRARDGKSDIKTTEVFDDAEIKLLELLKEEYEGATEKQMNPFDKENLAWASWTIARMGGWKGYQSQKPPGPITFFRGFQKFQEAFFIYKLTKSKYV